MIQNHCMMLCIKDYLQRMQHDLNDSGPLKIRLSRERKIELNLPSKLDKCLKSYLLVVRCVKNPYL